MNDVPATGARERRGARKEPKRQRSCEDRRQPSKTLAAEPLQSGRTVAIAEPPAPPEPTLTSFNPMRPRKAKTLAQAMQLKAGAELKRAIGKAMIAEDRDFTGGRFELAEAADMDDRAAEYLEIAAHVTGPVQPGNGGELIVRTQEAWGEIPGVIDTVRESPDMLSAGASRERLELTGNALPLAVDAAESIKAKNSLEKMLAHQLAASHRLGMMFADQSANLLERTAHFTNGNQTLTIEAARLANSAARMMAAFQDGLLALDKIRRGGRQTVKVIHQHVAVGPGGQAVVAGNLKSGGRRLKGRGAGNGQ